MIQHDLSLIDELNLALYLQNIAENLIPKLDNFNRLNARHIVQNKDVFKTPSKQLLQSKQSGSTKISNPFEITF